MSKLKLSLLFLVAICVASIASAQTAADVTAKFNEAAEKYNAKDFASAIPLFEETITMAEDADGDIDATLQNAQKFLITSYMSVGAASAKGGNFDDASESFKKAYDLADMTGSMMKNRAAQMVSNVYIAKGTSLSKAGSDAEAAEEFNKAYEFNNRDTKAALLAAKHYADAGNNEKGDEIYKSIIELGATHSKYAEAAQQASKAYANNYLVAASEAATAKDYTTVTANLDKIAAVDPTNAQALMMRVQSANNFKKFDDVIKYGDDAVAAQTDNAAKSNLNFMIGAAYQTKENKTKAIEYYKQVTEGSSVDVAKSTIEALSK